MISKWKILRDWQFIALLYCHQVIKAFGSPDFFKMAFPLLFDVYNTASPSKPREIPLAGDAKHTGN